MGDVLNLQEIDHTQVGVVGCKGALLGELSRIEGIRVPAGFCVTTGAFERIVAETPAIGDRLERLSRLAPGDREAVGALSAEIRRTLKRIAIPEELAAGITTRSPGSASRAGYAVRSSATGGGFADGILRGPVRQLTWRRRGPRGDSPGTSSRCWASLFTERAVTYRLRNGFDHRRDRHGGGRTTDGLSAGRPASLFTADPITSNRKIASVEARFRAGRGSSSPGLVNTDVYKVRDGELIAKVGRHQAAGHLTGLARQAGHGDSRSVRSGQRQPALTDAQVVARRSWAGGSKRTSAVLRTSNGAWPTMASGSCRAGRSPRCSQSPRPTTTKTHVYVSVGHQQMMTDPMKPLGLSLFRLLALPSDVRGRREAVRRRRPEAGISGDPRRHPRGPREIRSADRGRAADHPGPRRLRPATPGPGARRQAADRRTARLDRDRSGHRR